MGYRVLLCSASQPDRTMTFEAVGVQVQPPLEPTPGGVLEKSRRNPKIRRRRRGQWKQPGGGQMSWVAAVAPRVQRRVQ